MKSRQILLFYYILLLFHFFYILLYYFFLRLRKSNQRLRITQHTNVSGRLRHAIYYLFFKKDKTSIEFQNLMVQFCYFIRYLGISLLHRGFFVLQGDWGERTEESVRPALSIFRLLLFFFYLDTNTQWQALRRRELRH